MRVHPKPTGLLKRKRTSKNGILTGKKPIEINWKLVENYLIAGCSGREIAPNLGIHEDTLFRACEETFDMHWSDYAASKRRKGNSLLHAKQFDVANKGNVSMLIWLGKQRLKQKENPTTENSFDGKLGELLDLLKAKKRENPADEIEAISET